VTPVAGDSSSARRGGQDSDDDDEDDEDEDEEDETEFVDGEGVGMSEAEERLVASFMNSGEEEKTCSIRVCACVQEVCADVRFVLSDAGRDDGAHCCCCAV